jgi:sulfatase maturation enzyme AslB (radical SAM superfamily)
MGPYVELRINSNGQLNFCHVAQADAIPPKDNMANMTVDEYFYDSSTVKQVRQLLQQGQAVSQCQRCYKTEQAGIVSYRQRRNLQYEIFPGLDFDQSFQESTAWSRIQQGQIKPHFYHVSLSNLCNMACMMCHPYNSSLLASTWKRARLLDNSTPVLLDWTQGPAWPKFCQHLLNNPQIVCLHIMGGEPLYHKRFQELLEFLVEHQHTNFAFTFVTNGSVYNPHIADLLNHFDSVTIEISLDGVGLDNDYVRHASNTPQIIQNIQQWISHRNQQLDVVLRTVPQALTACTYKNLLQFALDHEISIDSNVLENPNYMKPNVLPDSIKQQIKQDLITTFDLDCYTPTTQAINLRNRHQIWLNVQKNARDLVQQLDEPCPDILNLQSQLVNYCAKFDSTRKLSVATHVPELLDFMKTHGYEQKLSAYCS